MPDVSIPSVALDKRIFANVLQAHSPLPEYTSVEKVFFRGVSLNALRSPSADELRDSFIQSVAAHFPLSEFMEATTKRAKYQFLIVPQLDNLPKQALSAGCMIGFAISPTFGYWARFAIVVARNEYPYSTRWNMKRWALSVWAHVDRLAYASI